MTVTTRPPPPPAPPSASPPAEQRFLLGAVSWQGYVAIGQALRDRPALRLTYDRGDLELMTTSPLHEKLKKRWGRLIEVLAEEFGLSLEAAGNMTLQREDLARGLEPDDCFWIAHEAQMRGRSEWDPARDPPPDLVIEIEVSRSALDRVALYGALGVPEVWRYDGEAVRVHWRQPDGAYQQTEQSPTFPAVPLQEVGRFLRPSEAEDYLGMVRSFRAWVRQHLPTAGA